MAKLLPLNKDIPKMWNSLEVAGGDTVNKVGMGTPAERREKKV